MFCQYVKDLLNICYDQFKIQEMCNQAVEGVPWVLKHVPNQFKTQEMCNQAVESDPQALKHVPDQFNTQEMCNQAVEGDPWMLKHVPDQFKTQEMCNQAVEKLPEVILFVPDWFKTQKMFNKKSPEVIWCYRVYKQCKAQKTKIKKELMLVAWHPDRWWNSYVPEDKKKELEIYFA